MSDLLAFLDKDDGRRSPLGYCVNFEDGMDGFVIHAEGCPDVGKGWIGGYRCISPATWKGRHPEWVDRKS